MPAISAIIHGLRYEDLPEDVRRLGRLAFLDLLGVAAAGTTTRLSAIVRNFAAENLLSASGGARMIFDGRRVSASGAAYAGASTIDAFDAHDGHKLTKGHAGVALLPALLALCDERRILDGREMLTSLVLGYEIATRAGIALHRSVSDYHTSGAWNALGVAAMAARALRLDEAATRHALGIAEYHGPRSQMMRCIDHPTMLKDGSGWGALTGLWAARLAADGFTGAPAVSVEDASQASLFADLGERWRMREQYFKLYPVCRWAQPALEAAAAVAVSHAIRPEDIEEVEIRTFEAGVRLGTKAPRTTEEAQYALGFPVAAYLVRGRLGAAEVADTALADPEIARMLAKIRLVEDPGFTRRFPAERLAVATLRLVDGSVHESAPTSAKGDPEEPLAEEAIVEKFRQLAEPLGTARSRAIEEAVLGLDRPGFDGRRLLDAVLIQMDPHSAAVRELAPMHDR